MRLRLEDRLEWIRSKNLELVEWQAGHGGPPLHPFTPPSSLRYIGLARQRWEIL
jgi:hypothetical protein